MPKNVDGVCVTIRTEVNPNEIKNNTNKLNWKTHTPRQLEYVGSSINNNGWLGQLLYCANTDRLLNGHGRLKNALNEGYRSVPVDVGWWSEEQGNEILASLDPTGSMASVDGNALNSLTEMILKQQKGKPKTSKTAMFKDVNSFAQQILDNKKDNIQIRKSKRSLKKIIEESTKSKTDERESISNNDYLFETERREDLLFPADSNIYGVPDLLSSKLYSDISFLPEGTFSRSNESLLSTMYYCQGSRPFDSWNHHKPQGGFLGFFTEDHLFEKYYNNPGRWLERLLDEKWKAVVEPDYSTFWDWPFALRLHSIYRARWCARYWQESGGIDVIPMLRRSDNVERDKWMYDSLPEDLPVAFMQLRMGLSTTKKDPDYWRRIGAVLAYVNDTHNLGTVLFYANPSIEKYVVGKVPLGLDYRFVMPYVDARNLARKKPKHHE